MASPQEFSGIEFFSRKGAMATLAQGKDVFIEASLQNSCGLQAPKLFAKCLFTGCRRHVLNDGVLGFFTTHHLSAEMGDQGCQVVNFVLLLVGVLAERESGVARRWF